MMTKLFAAAKKTSLLTMALVQFAHAGECGGMKISGLEDCFDLTEKSSHVAIYDNGENITISLIEDKKEVFKDEGLGYILHEFLIEDGKAKSAVLKNNEGSFILVRTKGDRTSTLFVYKVERGSLAEITIKDGDGSSNPYITTHFDGVIQITNGQINVKDRFFDALYEIKNNELSKVKYQTK